MGNAICHTTSIRDYDYTLIVHCFEQEAKIKPFLKDLEKVLQSLELDFLVVIIDDASRDNTSEVIKNYSLQTSQINFHLIPLQNHYGLQGAIQHGLSYAQHINCDHFIVMDINEADDPRAIPELISIKEKDVVFVDKGPKTDHLLFWLMYRFHQLFFWLLANREIKFDHYTKINRKALDLLLKTTFLHYATALDMANPLSKGKIRHEHTMEGFEKESRKLFRNSIGSLLEFGEALLNLFFRFSLGLAFIFFGGLIYAGIAKFITHEVLPIWMPFALIGLLNGLLLCIGFFALSIILLKHHKQVFSASNNNSWGADKASLLSRVYAANNDPVQLN